MIRYTLVCDQHHEFESWFGNSAAYDEQVKQGLVTCPMCGSGRVEKTLMTPRLARSDSPRRESREETHQDPNREHRASAAPGLQVSASEASEAAMPPSSVLMMTPQEQELRRKLRELRDHIVRNAEDVGARFPEEARKMHYGETDRRSIYGVASPTEAETLREEGIAFSALPVLPDDRN